MRFQFLKRLLSYFVELPVEATGSDYTPELNITLRKGRYQLDTGHAVYSYDDLYVNFREAFLDIPLDELPNKDVLVLGLGLGSIPYLLDVIFDKQFHYVAVEIDEEIIRLAEKYSLQRLSSSIELVHADAKVFVDVCEEEFGLICVDIFLDDVVPEAFEQPYFLEDCKRLLLPSGYLIFNRLARSDEEKASTQQYFDDVFQVVFPNSRFIEVLGNRMLIAKQV
jgi:spermidine synthase